MTNSHFDGWKAYLCDMFPKTDQRFFRPAEAIRLHCWFVCAALFLDDFL